MKLIKKFALALSALVFATLFFVLPAQALAPTDGWTVSLIPGTDKMLHGLGDVGQSSLREEGRQTDETTRALAPATSPPSFFPTWAVDGGRVIYSAFYGESPQVYLYDILSDQVTQLTDDGTDAETIELKQVQVRISGDWAAWIRGYGYGQGDINLCNLASGETRQFTPRAPVASWRLIGDRLVWQEEAAEPGAGNLYLYDPAVDSTREIVAAHGLICFATDGERIAWAGGRDGTEIYVSDFAGGDVRKVANASSKVGAIVVKNDVFAWSEQADDYTTRVVRRSNTGEQTVVDTSGAFYLSLDLQTDGRYVTWNHKEGLVGNEVWLYDTESGEKIELAGSAVNLDSGRLVWTQVGMGRDMVMVRDLATGLTTQLTNNPWSQRFPVVSGEHVVWYQYDAYSASPLGRGIFVATAPDAPTAPVFTDLGSDQPYRTAIQWLGEQGYSLGYPVMGGPQFRTDAPLLRQHFCIFLVRVLGIEVGDVPVRFADLDTTTSGNSYEAQVLATLARVGILRGNEHGLLNPMSPISRGQAVTLLVRAIDTAHPGLLRSFTGKPHPDLVHGANVSRAGLSGLLDGLDGYSYGRLGWDTWAPASRGEAAQMLWNAAGVLSQP
ncbi:MAG: hypothetical protein ACOX8V_03165 [Thermoleophilia bacterium]|jgi:hypothetical protein